MKLQILFRRYLLLAFFMVVGIASQNIFAQLSPATITNSNPTDSEIINTFQGNGVTFSNPMLVAGDRSQQIAIFTNGSNANLGMDDGILFSTGNAVNHLQNKNMSFDHSDIIGHTYVDPDLVNIEPEAINDAVVFTFDVTLDPDITSLRMSFKFGSEEYPDYVGSPFNDAFGFFISGPGISGTQNIARIPGSNVPVSINTVNYGVLGYESDTFTPVDLSNSNHYINNGHTTILEPGENYLQQDDRPGPFPVHIEYNGLTKLITYDFTNLTGGTTYNFKIAIADAYDGLLDAGVLIEMISGSKGADVAITKEVDNPNPLVCSEVQFTLQASNLGPDLATGVVVNDLLPSGYTFVNATPSKGVYDSNTGAWTIGTLNAITETATLNIAAILNDTGNHLNVATISAVQEDINLTNNTAEAEASHCFCYKPGLTAGGTILDTNVGITSLSRAGADNPDNWPMIRKGGWIALESKTKGFVPNRVEFIDDDNDGLTPDVPVGIPVSDFVEGMMVYDNTNKCLKIFTLKEGDLSQSWHCISTQTCPD